MPVRFAILALVLNVIALPEAASAAGWSSSSAPTYAALNRGYTLSHLWRAIDNR